MDANGFSAREGRLREGMDGAKNNWKRAITHKIV
jgi:hypothetical protein